MEQGEVQIPREERESAEALEKKPRHYKEVALHFGDRLSWHRLRRLLNTGKVEGKKVKRGDGERGYPEFWQTTVGAVNRYFENLKTPQEYGRRGGRPVKEKKGVGRRGVVFEGA